MLSGAETSTMNMELQIEKIDEGIILFCELLCLGGKKFTIHNFALTGCCIFNSLIINMKNGRKKYYEKSGSQLVGNQHKFFSLTGCFQFIKYNLLIISIKCFGLTGCFKRWTIKCVFIQHSTFTIQHFLYPTHEKNRQKPTLFYGSIWISIYSKS